MFIRNNLLSISRLKEYLRVVPELYFGPISSGFSVIKASAARDLIAQTHNSSLAVDMESGAIARACSRHRDLQLLIIKVISDFSNAEKTQIDNFSDGLFKECSLQSLFDLIITFLIDDAIELEQSSASIKTNLKKKWSDAIDDYSMIHEFVQDKYIDERLDFLRDDFDGIDHLETLFKSIVGKSDTSGIPDDRNDPIRFVCETLLDQSKLKIGYVTGHSGTGKTAFCLAVWRLLRHEISIKKYNFIPIYFSLDVYDRASVENALFNSKNLNDAVKDQLQPDISFIKELLDSKDKSAIPILIIDGFKPSNLLRQAVLRQILSRFDLKRSRVLLSVDSAFYLTLDLDRDIEFLTQIDVGSPQFFLKLRSVHVHSSRFPHLISAFCSLFDIANMSTKIADYTRQLEFSYADPFILLLIKEALQSNNNRINYYSALIEQYFRSEVNRDIETRVGSARGLSLKELEIAAAKIAYGLLTKNQELDLARIISEGIEGTQLKEAVSSLLPDASDANYALCVRALLTAYSTLTRHSVIRNVYAAKHVISAYETSPSDNDARRQHFRLLNHVYPNYINKCFKHLICTPGKAKSVLDGAFHIALDPKLSPLLREHAVYLIGRFAPLANYKDKALRVLRQVHEVETSFGSRFTKGTAKSSEEELCRRQHRLLVRATCIGRSYCEALSELCVGFNQGLRRRQFVEL